MNKRMLWVATGIICLIVLLSQCITQPAQDLRGPAYAGANTCVSCHRDIYNHYIQTTHFKTTSTDVLGNFPSSFTYDNGEKVSMIITDSGKVQGGHLFHLSVGSGRHAQTYLYWQNENYFQLPVSYYVSAGHWANSPGFPTSHPKFDRQIPSTCFGCHSAAVGIKSVTMVGRGLNETFEKGRLIYGIDCERCHGPAADHVAYHTAHPDAKKPMHMTVVRTLDNQQQLDMCALCHSGLKAPQKPLFEYKPGDAYGDYFFPDISGPSRPEQLDIHGTQFQLFTASRCFRESRHMNCTTCHDPHRDEGNKTVAFSKKCMQCHQQQPAPGCKFDKVAVLNCIDCHMPKLPSSKIVLSGTYYLRTHLIGIYKQ
ncbi:multiheme c-type cytochrome [Chitinophaga sp.]|uniref:multiheme c-type cytochrome n=1 Tax=Chitinophaga sp. TaxID=1869181 RepID=UPI0031DCF9DA